MRNKNGKSQLDLKHRLAKLEKENDQLKGIVKSRFGCAYCVHKANHPCDELCLTCGIEHINWEFKVEVEK